MVKHKISAPRLPAGIVQRERLFLHLDESSPKPVVWISGPGGSGKTMLVASYLESRNLPAIWYQVDQGDADPATFFYYMGLACRDVARPDQESLPLLPAATLNNSSPGYPRLTRSSWTTTRTSPPLPHFTS